METHWKLTRTCSKSPLLPLITQKAWTRFLTTSKVLASQYIFLKRRKKDIFFFKFTLVQVTGE